MHPMRRDRLRQEVRGVALRLLRRLRDAPGRCIEMSETKMTGFRGTLPGVTEAELKVVLDYWRPRAESITWREDKTNPFRKMFAAEGKKSYIITVKLKEEQTPIKLTGESESASIGHPAPLTPDQEAHPR